MARTTGRAPLVLTDEQEAKLSELAGSRTAPVREVERAGVLLKLKFQLRIDVFPLSFNCLL